MKLIGLTGRKYSGKSTAASYLRTSHGYVEYSFADPLKKAIIDIFDLPYSAVYGSELQKNTVDTYWKVSGRELMQVIGTELFRDELVKYFPHLEDVWSKRLYKDLISFNDEDDKVVVSDVRFPSDAALIRRLGGKIVKIVRNESEQIQDSHMSENQNIVPDIVIENNHSMEEFYELIDITMINLKI